MHEWQQQFKLKQDLKHKDIVAIEQSLIDMRVSIKDASTNTGAGIRICAAIDAGWVLEPACEVGNFEDGKRYFYDGTNIDDLHPGKVRWLGMQVERLYSSAVEIPPN